MALPFQASHYLRHDCICCSANPPTDRPTDQAASQPAHPPHRRPHLLHPADVTRQGEGECSVCRSVGTCGEALSSSTFYTCSLQPERLHPSTTTTTHHGGDSRRTYSDGTAIWRGGGGGGGAEKKAETVSPRGLHLSKQMRAQTEANSADDEVSS